MVGVASETVSGLDEFNKAPADRLRVELLALTAAPAWADALLAGRPYADREALLASSDELVQDLDVAQIDAALAGHPRIGERAAGRDEEAAGRDEEAAARSAKEQAAMSSADACLQAAMARGNADYERRFGRIYLVAAAGRSAEELLDLLHARLDNDADIELEVVRGELARITRLRLADLLTSEEDR
ncbi:MAG: 2-oxo-4-hydroxy-4-carboxy-5-ureidoimidazoline decarboxylase [Propionibacteriales bacterium]|nr:2-oxo-4-hydroxy-4-carboxy-5-ureidoimidazoline decarboxylase [Propionibacteriales bacterium]